MANRKGLGVSKKYANGTVHENGTGQFSILNRYEGEDGNAWLEYEWLTGDKVGQVESNKEININASIHKFIVNKRASGELPVLPPHEQRVNTDHVSILDKIDTLMDTVDGFEEFNEGLTNKILGTAREGVEAALHNRKSMDELLNKMCEVIDTINVKTEAINTLTATVERMTFSIEKMLNSNDIVEKQQEMLNKMLEKI